MVRLTLLVLMSNPQARQQTGKLPESDFVTGDVRPEADRARVNVVCCTSCLVTLRTCLHDLNPSSIHVNGGDTT